MRHFLGLAMQTFLPYEDFHASAKCLDSRRLGNQCYNETYVLINGGWQQHPASKMWRNYRSALARYGLILALEMRNRGGWRQTVTDRWINYYTGMCHYCGPYQRPHWLGDEAFHLSHQSNLKRKDSVHYPFPGVPNDLPYVWPVK